MSIEDTHLAGAKTMRTSGMTYTDISNLLGVSCSSVRRMLVEGEIEKDKQYRKDNSDKIRFRDKQYRIENSVKCQDKQQRYYLENRLKISIRNKEYRSKHKQEYSKYLRDYQCEHRDEINKRARYKRHSDIHYLLSCNLRTRLCQAMKRGQKSGSAVSDLGCTIHEFKQYLESRFTIGMSWDNRSEWHIDHIIPLSNFDLTDRGQLLQACHYTNLQPLWAEDNLKKSNRFGGKQNVS